MSHWQVFETPLPGYSEQRFLRCAVWANAPRDALLTLHNHDRCWQQPSTRQIAIWEENHKHDPGDHGLVHWVVDARGNPIGSAAAPSGASAAPPAASETALTVQSAQVPQAVVSAADSLPLPTPTPATYPADVPHSGGHSYANPTHVARETPDATQTIRQLASELDALKAYIRGQTLADLAFQEHALLENARRSGDVNLIKSAEASAASSFGPDWRQRIPALLDKGRALDAAALQS